MLSPTQRSILMEAAKGTAMDRADYEAELASGAKPKAAYNPSKRIDEAIKFIKQQSPELFFHDVENKIDPAMRMRKFHDEPRNLPRDEYFSYVVPYAPPVIKRG